MNIGSENISRRLKKITAFTKNTWLHNVVDMTCDTAGNIYWRNLKVDVVDTPEHVKQCQYIKKLRDRCERLYSKGIPVNTDTVGFYYSWFKEMAIDDPYKALLSRCPDIRVSDKKILFLFACSQCEFNQGEWHYSTIIDRRSDAWDNAFGSDALLQKGYDIYSLSWVNLDIVKKYLALHKVPADLLERMSEVVSERGKA